jgi:hypothetical protein
VCCCSTLLCCSPGLLLLPAYYYIAHRPTCLSPPVVSGIQMSCVQSKRLCSADLLCPPFRKSLCVYDRCGIGNKNQLLSRSSYSVDIRGRLAIAKTLLRVTAYVPSRRPLSLLGLLAVVVVQRRLSLWADARRVFHGNAFPRSIVEIREWREEIHRCLHRDSTLVGSLMSCSGRMKRVITHSLVPVSFS